MSRILQVIQYGWMHSEQMMQDSWWRRILIFGDILWCFHRYRMWSNEYLKENFYFRTKDEREQLGGGD